MKTRKDKKHVETWIYCPAHGEVLSVPDGWECPGCVKSRNVDTVSDDKMEGAALEQANELVSKLLEQNKRLDLLEMRYADLALRLERVVAKNIQLRDTLFETYKRVCRWLAEPETVAPSTRDLVELASLLKSLLYGEGEGQ
jgi:hypothetical protein